MAAASTDAKARTRSNNLAAKVRAEAASVLRPVRS